MKNRGAMKKRGARLSTRPYDVLGTIELQSSHAIKTGKQRRAGATETFSVSVDPETKRALRALADEDFGGNLSALVTDLAAEARRRLAAKRVLRRFGMTPFTSEEAEAFQTQVQREAARVRSRRRKRKAA